MPFYSPQTQSFYCPTIHKERIPDDAILITDEEHMALVDGINNQGKDITIDASGHPALCEPPSATTEERQATLNQRARTYLNATDWMVIRHQETGVTVPASILSYRAMARRCIVDPEPILYQPPEDDFSL